MATYPGATDCLKNLSILTCYLDASDEFFHQLSLMCHHIQSLIVTIKDDVSICLAKFISVQRSFKSLKITNDPHACDVVKSFISMAPFLTKLLSKTLIKLDIHTECYVPLSFIANFTNLRELVLLFDHNDNYFIILQDVTFPHLRVLRFKSDCPLIKYLTKFLKLNGKNLRELSIPYGSNNSLNVTIAKNCPNLRSLFTEF